MARVDLPRFLSQVVGGDILLLCVRMEAGHVAEVAYKVRGCAASIAAGSKGAPGAGSTLSTFASSRARANLRSTISMPSTTVCRETASLPGS